jgi:cell filamentation protein
MIFDPFGDFESRGYLRNRAAHKDLRAVKEDEHSAFLEYLPAAVGHLGKLDRIAYEDVLTTHKILFGDVYPWAGQDRLVTAPHIAIARGGRADLFAHPRFVQDAIHYALRLGQDRAFMAARPGEVMGYLAYGHPFLDGNGRTVMVVHIELAHRAGISVDWGRTEKAAYLEALTRELDRPGKGELDGYLKPFVGSAVAREQASSALAQIRGLGPLK